MRIISLILLLTFFLIQCSDTKIVIEEPSELDEEKYAENQQDNENITANGGTSDGNNHQEKNSAETNAEESSSNQDKNADKTENQASSNETDENNQYPNGQHSNNQTNNKEQNTDSKIEKTAQKQTYTNPLGFELTLSTDWAKDLKSAYQWHFYRQSNDIQAEENLFLIVQESDHSLETLHEKLKADLQKKDVSLIWNDTNFTFEDLEKYNVDSAYKSYAHSQNNRFKNYFYIFSVSKKPIKIIVFYVSSVQIGENNSDENQKAKEKISAQFNEIINSIKF